MEDSWRLTVNDQDAGTFSYVTIATGQYPGGDKKYMPTLANRDAFKGVVGQYLAKSKARRAKGVRRTLAAADA